MSNQNDDQEDRAEKMFPERGKAIQERARQADLTSSPPISTPQVFAEFRVHNVAKP